MTKQLWSINGLATELDIDRRTIASALKTAPADGEIRGNPAWYLVTALSALKPPVSDGEALDPAQERARKDRALAISAEIKNDIATGKVILADDAERTWTALILIARTRLLAIPTKAAARVPGNVQRLVYDFVEEEVILALTDLSEADIVSEDAATSQEAA